MANRGFVVARTPVRIDFTGGYTDVPPFISERKGYAVNAAITIYTYVKARLRTDQRIKIVSEDFETIIEETSAKHLKFDGNLDLVKSIIQQMNIPNGIDIFIKSEAPPSSGLGTSGALGVAIVGIITALLGEQRSKKELADLASKYERNAGFSCGLQDQYAASFGGFHLFEYFRQESMIKNIQLNQAEIGNLLEHVLLVHFGGARISGNLVDIIMNQYLIGDSDVRNHFMHLNDLALKIYANLDKLDISKLSKLLNEVRRHQVALHKDITNPQLEVILSNLKRQGVWAIKALGGAGGGACILVFSQPQIRDKVIDLVKKQNGRVLPFSFDEFGLQISSDENWKTS